MATLGDGDSASNARALGRVLKKAKRVAATGNHADTDEVIGQLSSAHQAILKTCLTAPQRLELKAICETARIRRQLTA